MAIEFDLDLIAWMKFWDDWREWASKKPSLKHPIKYIKWYFSEPNYYEMIRKVINK